ncbi:MAG: hypothetical protein KGZ97_11125 [Bacteroidetes bacterium]|nr:hypothetical protein [Bacteroidota bacterium]
MKRNSHKYASLIAMSRSISMKNILLIFGISLLFSLSSCEIEDVNARNKFLGTWKVSELSSYYGPPPMTYNVNISASNDDVDEIIISNFFNMGSSEKVYAYVSGNSVTIPSQTICDDSITVSGSGSFRSSSNDISLSYSTNDGAVLDNLSATLTKL